MAIASPSARQTVSEPPTPGDRHDHGDPNKIGLINRDFKRAPSANCPSSRHKRPPPEPGAHATDHAYATSSGVIR
jgi:hypothetical protein